MKSGAMRFSKIISVVILVVLGLFVLTACSYDVQIFKDIDFSNSPFKHITNGGKEGDSPYNINAITGATLTVEGPGIKSSVPLSTKELENTNDGLVRGIYKDKNGKFVYEGIDVYYLLSSMNEGDNGIITTDKAYKVVFKDSNRETVAELTLEEIEKAHNDNQPVIIAYGVADENQKTIAPFVFDGANEGEHTSGYIDSLDNEDGCLKLVYNTTKYGSNKYKEYSNCAYLYVCEEKEPGFKHEENKNYIISVSGNELGYEVDFTVEQLEALVNYDKDGNIAPGGLGYSDFYSLANNTYWYVNEYEGLDLYKFLQYVGMRDAGTLDDDAEDTFVTFAASDGYTSSEKFSVAKLADYDSFGYYKKNSADLNDGNYKSTNADLVKTGYPVLLAYGVNNYPYAIKSSDDGFVSGISNNGGPMRVIFGKVNYNHANGSNQIQYLSDIIVGGKDNYNTHKDSRKDEIKKLADSEIQIIVNNIDGSNLSNETYTVKDIEDLVYAADVTANQIKAAKGKNVYEVSNGKEYVSDIYEGINLEYLISEFVGVPGTNGTVIFSDGKNEVKIDMNDLFAGGYNVGKGIDNQTSILAFAKNGSPMVANKNSKGYVESIKLNPIASTDPATYKVDNVGGPLAVIIPSDNTDKANAQSVFDVKTITINIEPDRYAHLEGDSAKFADRTITFKGEGISSEKTFTVADIESMQKAAKTIDFDILSNKGMSKERYRGVTLYDLLLNVGIQYNADEVKVYSEDGSCQTFALADLRKNDYLIAYGAGSVDKPLKEGTPLVTENGGPLKLIVPQADEKDLNAKLCVKNVTRVEVTAKEMTSWDHSTSDVYSEFLDCEFEVIIKNDKSQKSKLFKLKDLEKLSDLTERTEYSVLELGACEGINAWKLAKYVAGDVDISNPISFTVFASDGYSKDYLSIFGMEDLEKGVIDADGVRKPIIVCYAVGGYPLVDTSDHEGYTGLVANADGPIRMVAETNQGACIKHAGKLVIQISGSDNLN